LENWNKQKTDLILNRQKIKERKIRFEQKFKKIEFFRNWTELDSSETFWNVMFLYIIEIIYKTEEAIILYFW